MSRRTSPPRSLNPPSRPPLFGGLRPWESHLRRMGLDGITWAKIGVKGKGQLFEWLALDVESIFLPPEAPERTRNAATMASPRLRKCNQAPRNFGGTTTMGSKTVTLAPIG